MGTIGRLSKIKVSDDDVTYNSLGKVTSGTFSISDDVADDTNNDSNGYKEEVLSDQQMTVDFEVKYLVSDTAQAQVITAKTGRTTIYVEAYPQETSGEKKFKFLANITELSIDTQTSEVITMTGTFQSTGTITTSTQ
jgi:hypothetical protein